jgi:hypothetical protein
MPGFLALKIGAVGLWDDGDIVDAFGSGRCLRVNGEMVCRANGARDGRYHVRGTLHEAWLERSCRYRFRHTLGVVERTDLVSGLIDLLGPRPNAAGEAIEIEAFLARRLAHPRHRIFGSPGSEVWYGGTRTVDVDELWAEIEARTDKRKVEHETWPFSRNELRRFLVLPTDDISDEQAHALVEPLLGEPDRDGERPMLKRRRRLVNWPALTDTLGRSREDIESRETEVDVRTREPLSRAAIVETKPEPEPTGTR